MTMKISRGDLSTALELIGKDPAARQIMIDALRRIDETIVVPDKEIREIVTGPVLDAMHPGEVEVTKELADGARFTARYTSKIIRDFVLAPERPDHVWEPQTTKAVLHFARTARNVVVGGAYIGDHAVLLARVLPVGAKVHCFEPSSNAELLAKNARANQLDNLVVNQIGLWSQDNCELVLVGDDSHAHPAVASEGQKGAFKAVTIDGYGQRNSIGELGLILLDIEGGEMAALTGARTYLEQPAGRAPAVLFEVHSSYTDWSRGLEQTDICQLLTSHGYSVFALRDYNSNVAMPGRPVEFIPADDVYLEGPPHGFNMLAVKDLASIEGPMFRLVRGVSPKLLKHRDPKLHAPLT